MNLGSEVEPASGMEPPTCGLRKRFLRKRHTMGEPRCGYAKPSFINHFDASRASLVDPVIPNYPSLSCTSPSGRDPRRSERSYLPLSDSLKSHEGHRT